MNIDSKDDKPDMVYEELKEILVLLTNRWLETEPEHNDDETRSAKQAVGSRERYNLKIQDYSVSKCLRILTLWKSRVLY